MTIQASSISLAISLIALGAVFVQIRILSRDVQLRNHQNLIDRLCQERAAVVQNNELLALFEENEALQKIFKEADITPTQFFWMLNYMTAWEAFYYRRQRGLLQQQTWDAYVETMKTVMKTPKIRKACLNFLPYGHYRKDWSRFIASICEEKQVTDPKHSLVARWMNAKNHPLKTQG